MSARRTIVRMEQSSNQNLSIRLQSHTQHEIVGAAAGIEGTVECSIRVDARNAIAWNVVVEKERTSDEDLAIRLQYYCLHELWNRTI